MWYWPESWSGSDFFQRRHAQQPFRAGGVRCHRGGEDGWIRREFVRPVRNHLRRGDVRRLQRPAQRGDTARLVNKLLEHMEKLTAEDLADNLREVMGHTPLQVLLGALLGLGVGLLV